MGGGGGGSNGAVDSVPTDVDGVMYFDGSIATDQATTELMNGLIEMSDQEMGPDDPSNWDEVLEQAESESEIAVEDFDSATLFFQVDEDAETSDVDEEYVGVIVESDWTWEEIVTAADGEMDDLKERTYNGVTVYADTTEGEESWAADFGDGSFAFGTEKAVRDAIDTREGDADSFGGDLRDAYDSAGDGLVKVAMNLSEESIGADDPTAPDVSVMTMSYSSSGSEMQFSAQMTVPSEEEAENFAGTLNFGLGAAVEEEPELAGLVENLEIDNDGNRVTLDYTTTTDDLLDQLEDLDDVATPGGVGISEADSGTVGDEGGFDESVAGGGTDERQPPGTAAGAADSVPAGVDGVVYVDGAAVTDRATTELLNGVAGTDGTELSPVASDSWAGAIAEFEAESGLSVDGFEHATVFFRYTENYGAVADTDEYAGAIVETDWAYDEFLAAADSEIDDVEMETYSGVTVAVNSTEDADQWLADLGDGTFAVGTEPAVTDIIDTRQGVAPFGGDLRAAYAGIGDGLVQTAISVPERSPSAQGSSMRPGVGDIRTVSMVYTTDGSEIRLRTDLTTSSRANANEIASTLRIATTTGTDDSTLAASVFDNTEVTATGNTVTLDYMTTTDDLLDRIERTDSRNQSTTQQSAIAG